MAGTYDHLFVTEMQECRLDMVNEGEAAGKPLPPNLSDPWAAMRSSDVPGATAYITTSWVHEVDHDVEWVEEHDHEYDEILMFLGNDPNNVNDLGGEVYMTVEGEQHILTTTSSLFIPRGTKHCPLGFKSVSRPFRFIAVALSGNGKYLP
ncbi:hypothetical protein [Pseudonocardia acaciae]|uniref:hypothetical protein n=1 Tax=Pseudonocardia acaciae TaxID=551276 RepID=UPI00049102D5|nr:hypothetical protein [Pseudonocardia acaciae]